MNAMQSFTTPGKLYFRQGCLPVALRELADVYHASRVLIETDEEMLHNGRLAPITNALHELGLDYAVNAAHFEPDCVLVYKCNIWGSLPENCTCVILAADMPALDVPEWLSADMVILDEDLYFCDKPACVQQFYILLTAFTSLSGENASEYTLAWAVQAMRLALHNGSLLYAMALAKMASSIAIAPGSVTPLIHTNQELEAEAMEALGMTRDAFEARFEEISRMAEQELIKS